MGTILISTSLWACWPWRPLIDGDGDVGESFSVRLDPVDEDGLVGRGERDLFLLERQALVAVPIPLRHHHHVDTPAWL